MSNFSDTSSGDNEAQDTPQSSALPPCASLNTGRRGPSALAADCSRRVFSGPPEFTLTGNWKAHLDANTGSMSFIQAGELEAGRSPEDVEALLLEMSQPIILSFDMDGLSMKQITSALANLYRKLQALETTLWVSSTAVKCVKIRVHEIHLELLAAEPGVDDAHEAQIKADGQDDINEQNHVDRYCTKECRSSFSSPPIATGRFREEGVGGIGRQATGTGG